MSWRRRSVTFTFAPASGGTMTSCAAGTPPGQQRRVHRHRPLDQGQPDRAELVVPGRRAGEPDCGRRLQLDRVAVAGQPVLAAVQAQEDQPPRRVAEVVHSRDRLLAAVAALVQVHGGLDPADLVRDGPVVGVQAEPGDVRGDPERLERPHARRRGPPPHQVPGRVRQPVPRHDQVMVPNGPGFTLARTPSSPAAMSPAAGPSTVSTAWSPADVGHLDPQHEPHGLEELHQRRGGARLHVHPRRGAVVGQRQVVFDVPVRAEDERLRARSGRQPVQRLRGQAVQPAQPVRPGDPDDAAVGPVHHARRLLGRALLAQRVAVVRGHALVRPAGLHRSRRMLSSWLVRPQDQASAAVRQSAQRPKTVRWPTSVSKPWRSSSAVISGRIASGPISVTRSQSRQTRCTWSASAARW